MYAKRLAAITAYLGEHQLDALLVTNFFNILYLTGLKTLSPHEREAYLLITKGKKAYVFTDGRYEEQFRLAKELELKVLTPQQHIMQQLKDLSRENNLAAWGFEREDLKWSEYEVLKNNLQVELVPVDRLVLGKRSIKDKAEIEKLSQACRIGDECLAFTFKNIRPGMTEKQIAWEMEKWVRERGYAFSFEPIVAVDAHAAIPHYNTREGEGTVGSRSLVLIDMGVMYENYCSDITRVGFMSTPAPATRHAYESLLSAQKATIEELGRTGELQSPDLFCRGRLLADGYPSYPHSTGHGVGLEVHEFPKLSSVSGDMKQAGQAFTVEPGIYLPGKWGIRIEDTVAVRDNGIDILTKFPKDLLVL